MRDTAEDEIEVRRITNQQLVPLLAESLDLGPYFGRSMVWARDPQYDSDGVIEAGASVGLTGARTVTASRELASTLAVRGFYADFAVSGLRSLLESLDRSIVLLEDEEAA